MIHHPILIGTFCVIFVTLIILAIDHFNTPDQLRNFDDAIWIIILTVISMTLAFAIGTLKLESIWQTKSKSEIEKKTN